MEKGGHRAQERGRAPQSPQGQLNEVKNNERFDGRILYFLSSPRKATQHPDGAFAPKLKATGASYWWCILPASIFSGVGAEKRM